MALFVRKVIDGIKQDYLYIKIFLDPFYITSIVSLLTPTLSHTYTYGNAGWKEQLTAFDGVAITYDAMGTPERRYLELYLGARQTASPDEQDRRNGLL